MSNKDDQPPERIYLQCYDEYDGHLLDFVSDDVTWHVDQISDNDAVYALVTEHPLTKGKFAYVGRKSCGCAAGVVTDLGDGYTANAVADFIASGLVVDCVPWSTYRRVAAEKTFMACPHGQLSMPLEDSS